MCWPTSIVLALRHANTEAFIPCGTRTSRHSILAACEFAACKLCSMSTISVISTNVLRYRQGPRWDGADSQPLDRSGEW